MQRCRVLIVEDNSTDRELLKASLRKARPTLFEFAEEAAAAGVRQRIKDFRPDCLLLDLNLPDADGLEILSDLSLPHESLPVIVITAFGNEQIAVEAMKAGATDYIVKTTVTSETLLHTVENAIEKWRLKTEITRQQERYRMLTDAIPQIVWTANPDGEFDYISRRWVESTGRLVEDALGCRWLSALHPDDRERVAERWREAREQGTRFEEECRLSAPDESYRWQLACAIPQTVNRAIVHWFGTFTDIEDRRRAEQAMFQKQKLESTGLLAGGIAHDFNNLLVGILGGISYALESLSPAHIARPTLEIALLSSERAAMLTRQMLAYVGKGKFVLETVDLCDIVKSTCSLIAASIPKMVSLNIMAARNTPFVEADPSQIQQIIMNLVINAAESIGEDKTGIVTIRTGFEHLDRKDPADELDPGVYAVLEVVDTGCGMSEELQCRIFEPFFTTKFTGRGLGLAAVMGIVRSAKGAIRVRSAVGQGTTIRILLPAKCLPVDETEPKHSQMNASASARVLVVDDEEMVRRTAELALQRAGFIVHTATGGKEAVMKVRTAPDEFDLVLLDMNMPDLSGEETLRQLRTLRPAIRVAIFSGYSEQEVWKRLGSQTVAGILPKPFTARTLSDKVASFLTARPANA